MKKNTNSNKPEENGIYAGTSDRIIDDVVKGKRDYKDSLFCFIFVKNTSIFHLLFTMQSTVRIILMSMM